MTDHIVVGIKRDTAVFQCLIKNNNIGQMQQNMHGSSLSNGYDFKNFTPIPQPNGFTLFITLHLI